METIYFLGIDVAKEGFQTALTVDGVTLREYSIENSSEAIRPDWRKFATCAHHVAVCDCRKSV